MGRKMQTNSFEKGMNKSISKDRLPPVSYRDARNFRLSDDGSDSGGALVNVKGNSLELNIPTSPNVFKVIPIANIDAPIAGVVDNFVVSTVAGSVTVTTQLVSGGFEDYFNQIVDEANNVASQLYSLGIKVIRTSAKSISVYSENTEIVSVNSLGQSDYTYGYEFAKRQSNLEIIGWTEIRDSLVICTTNNKTEVGGNGQIWYASYDKISDSYTLSIRYTNDNINFSTQHPIEMVSRFENLEIQRTYWTDNFNNVRTLNVASVETSMGVDEAFLNLTPSITFSRPVLKTINSGGSLKAGIYQYAYRLSSSTGAQSRVSPASRLINVLANSESGVEWSQLGEYTGTNPGDATTKSVTIDIKNIDLTYDTIELLYLYYGAAEATPEAFIFDTVEVPSSGELTITHTGVETTSEVTDTEYKLFGTPFEKAKTISYKDNRLIAANVTTPKNESLQFHARAYRFGNSNTDTNIFGSPAYNSGNSYQVTGLVSNIKSYVPGLNVSDVDWGYEDPESVNTSSIVRDAVNPYNKADWNSQHLPFKWKKDGQTLGGEGPYVSYKFITQDAIPGPNTEGYFYGVLPSMNNAAPLLESRKQTTIYDFNTNDEEYNVATSPLNHKSPYINNIFKGYPPGEVIRYGIVLYDKAGNAGFVNWIGDIKFPERWEMRANMDIYGSVATGETLAGGAYSNGKDMLNYKSVSTSKTLELNQLGLEFEITIPDSIINDISGYEIVRVKRDVSNRTKLAQGIAHFVAQAKSDDLMYIMSRKPGPGFLWDVSGMTGQGGAFKYPDFEDISTYPDDAKKSLVIYSPELQFFNNIGSSLNDRIRVEGAFSEYSENNLAINATPLINYTTDHSKKVIHPGFEAGYGDATDLGYVRTNGKKTLPIDFAREVNVGETISSIDTLSPTSKFINTTLPSTDLLNNEVQVDGALCLFVTLGGGVELFLPEQSATESGGIGEKPLLVTYERELLDQYGGNTQAARANNTYIKTGGFIKVNQGDAPTTTLQVFGGDVYHAEYDFTRTDGKEPNSPVSYTSRDGVIVPLISTFNTTLRNGRHFLNKALPNGDYPDASDTAYAHDTYEIEDLYSREDDYVTFIGRQVGVELLETFDNRVYASRGKINGETIDNWRQFEAFLYKDVEGSLGPINKVINHNDNIYFFQDHGCGYMLINPRGSVTGGPAGSLQIGFGDVLHDFEYISSEIGCFHQWVPISTNENLMFIDSYHKQMYAIRGKQLIPMSLQTGMNPWFFEQLNGTILNTDNPLMHTGIHSTWDRRFNEIWFTFLNKEVILNCSQKTAFVFHSFPSSIITANALVIQPTCGDVSLYKIGNYITVTINGESVSFEITEIDSNDSGEIFVKLPLNSFFGGYEIYNNAIDNNGVKDYYLFSVLGKKSKTEQPLDISMYRELSETIVFNEAYDLFTGYYDHAPTIYINDGVNILSPNPKDLNTLYRHNKGKYGEFYGNTFKSTLQLIINDGKGITKVFDNFGYYTEVISNSSNPIHIDQETFSRIRCNTNYQNTDWVNIIPKNNIRKVDREWQLAISRNAVLKSFGATPVDIDIFNPANLDTTQEFKDRLRDKIMIADFEFDNINDRRFLLHYLKTFYRFSAR